MKKLLVVSAIIACLYCPNALGDDPYMEVRDFGRRMTGGTWRTTLAGSGDAAHSYRWQFGNTFLLRASTAAGKHLAVIGVDPTTGKRTEWVFGEDGTVAIHASTTRDRDGAAHTAEVSSGVYAGKYRIEHETDRISITPIDVSASSPFQSKTVWKREPLDGHFPSLESKPPQSIPQSMSGLASFDGYRHVDGQMSDGQKAKGISLGRWILGGKFFLYVSSFVNKDQSDMGHLFVAGTDPETGKSTNWEFTSDGSVGTSTMSDDGRMIQGKMVARDGSVFEFSGSFEMDGDVLNYSAVGKTKEHPSMPYSWQWTKSD